MKAIYVLFFMFLCPFLSPAQTVTVSGKCMTGNITLNKIADLNGKSAYQGTAQVLGYDGITITVYWIGAPDNVWVIDYEGQPYFYNTCTSVQPPSTENTSCHWIPVEGTECPGSPALVVNGTGTQSLAVSLHSLDGKVVDEQVSLVWKTSSESNNKGFEIQRSNDAVTWKKIGFVNGGLNSTQELNYVFNDIAPIQGSNFYRLKQYDMDGKATLSSIINVEVLNSGTYTLSNNPGNGIYTLHMRTANGVKMSISDLAGRRLIHKNIDAGIHQIDISEYAPGIYLLHLQVGNKIKTEKLLKQ